MIEIDGSYGEGGGQILRTAVSISVLTKKPVKITRIRAKRNNPGLRPQHRCALEIMKELSNAETKGLSVGSTEVMFQPGLIQGGQFEFDIGTAGSMVLVFQTIILGLLHTKEPVTIRLHGGSDVKWSPSWDYFKYVFLPVINQMGVIVSTKLERRGYYPKGGGTAEIRIEPLKNDLSPLCFDVFIPTKINGIIHLGNLPDHIAKRMKHTIIKKLVNTGIPATIQTQRSESRSSGVGITLWTQEATGALGSVQLGEKGVPAETVAQNALDHIINDIKNEVTVDEFLSDQILPYLALCKQESVFYVQTLTDHFTTNKWVLDHFLDLFSCQCIDQHNTIKVLCKNNQK